MAIKVLFLCIHNSARSQMAEMYLRKYGGEQFEVESAGLEPGKLNPLAVVAMLNDGIDISHNSTKSVFDFHFEGKTFDYVISVCDAANAARCPVFPGEHQRINWDFDDPSLFIGNDKEKITKTIAVRDAIKQAVQLFVEKINNQP